jgi:transposase InsO family protein
VRTAEQPGQALNIDLCFVPEQHLAQAKLPAVSGSSGHLVIERLTAAENRPRWPGQVFGEADVDYETAMRQYVAETQDRQIHGRSPRAIVMPETTRWRQEWDGRSARYQVQQRRKQEDTIWKAAKLGFQQVRQSYQQLPKAQRQQQQPAWQLAQAIWQQVQQGRQAQRQVRLAENQVWHAGHRTLKTSAETDAVVPGWIAILVVTDNCTRQCLGLPLFRTGAKVTSREVQTALQRLLPAELQFLISDQGKHFRTQSMLQLAQANGFVHVLVYRHRPESNGIAERFVLTLKNGLRSTSWQSVDELQALLTAFRPAYNDRPHQGIAIPGLSPNEFAHRIWLM